MTPAGRGGLPAPTAIEAVSPEVTVGTRSQRLGLKTYAAAVSGDVLYTVPPNTRTIVKQVSASNGSGAASDGEIVFTSGAQNFTVLQFQPIGAQTVIDHPTWHVLLEGDEIRVFCFTPPFDVMCSGSELLGP